MGKKLNKNVPVLRFPEFEEDWTEKKLNEISNRISDGIHSTPKYDENGEYYFINGNNLIDDKIEFGENTKRVNKSEYLKYKSELTPQTILISINGTIGNLAFYDNEKIVLGKSACYIDLNSEENKFFVFYLLQTSSIKNHFNKELTGSKIKNLSLTTIKNTKSLFPSYNEQEKIASFLRAVDRRLTQLRRKRELLQTYKRGVMQKIFSQEIRFKGAIGSEFPEWERKKLGDLLTIRYGKDHQNLEDGEYPVLGTGGVMRYINSYLYDKPSILIGRKGTIDQPQFVTYPFWTVDTLFYSEIHPEIVPFFLFLVVLSINWKKYNEATGVPSLNTSSINNIKVIIATDVKEQEKIANFLTAIDRKIEILSRQIDQTKQFKKGLLQKMFV